MKSIYYKNSVRYCINYFGENKCAFVIFADDDKSALYLETVNFLKSLGNIEFYCSNDGNNIFSRNSVLLKLSMWKIMIKMFDSIYNNIYKYAIYDLYQMSQCDVLISSPSTFAVCAGILGKQKKIIHSKEWLDYSVGNKDRFWVNFKEYRNPCYCLWKDI